MGTMTRKQREIRERDQLLQRVARKMLIEQGYSGLSMDQLAEATEYSKGTIYQHFSTKEDLVTALAIESMERRVELFLRAEKFVGRSRERMLAIGVADEIFSRLETHHYRSESACFGSVVRIVQSGIDQGELPKEVDPRELVYSVFTMALGTHMTALHYCPMLKEFEIRDPVKVLLRGIHILLDGFEWKPLRVDWDYGVTYQRICAEIFAEEQKRLAGC